MRACGSLRLSSDHELPSELPSLSGSAIARGWRHRLTEPSVLFTALALVILAVIWGTTLHLAANERAVADRAAAALAADVAATYEAQIVRALREIDNTLRLVRFNLEENPPDQALRLLRARGLLPPELLFTVSIRDAAGEVVASTDPSVAAHRSRAEFLRPSSEDDGMAIGLPRRDELTGEWQLDFSRLLETADLHFSGAVEVSVYAAYFVSGYDPNVLGAQGMLGLLGSDGVLRVWRSGDEISAGQEIDYASLVPDDDFADVQATVEVNSWDGVSRYTVARRLFEFPLAIVVGLSEEEQLAPAAALERAYFGRAALASTLVVLILAMLGRLSWQLQQARSRAMEEKVEHAQRVEYLAYHDALTDLPNRALFSRLLTQGMHQARRYERGLALLFLDLDRFKIINDSLGHDAGDELLQEVARRLLASVRQSDVVARLGGDEFVVLLPEINEGSQAAPIADKILAAVSKPFTLAGQEFRVTVSIGVSIFPADGEDEETLMKNADVAMYHAKEQGKNNFQFYSEKLNTDSLERLALESSMRNAIERGEFRLYYQAKHAMSGGRVTGMEALLRWQHPDLGLILPMQFIPLAEETGLIVPLGRWVLKTACLQNVAWQKKGLPGLPMAVNLSARQFLDEHLLDDVSNVLRDTGMDPKLLELEITESMIMRDMTRTIEILTKLKAMGVRVAIDDFGTGYSSLSTLKWFPLDTIKIDGSFIHDLGRSTADQSLMEAIIAVGKSLSLTVVAEGVESADQVDFLRAHACDEFQGFYINQPMPAEEFVEQLRTQIHAG
jgi:diguanylate cyclase (GGDEF)-like protein